MNEKNFVHLHVHTEFSLLDGAARISELLDTAKNLGMKSIAVTDHGTMYGVIDFYKAAVKRGIKPIIGCEVYLAPTSRFFRDAVDGVKYYHLILLAENNEGYKNLVKLVSLAATEGFYYKPRIDKEILRKYHTGLIALSACTAGEIPNAILQNNFSHAEKLAKEYLEIFGQGNFFLEIQNHGMDEEKKVRDALQKISANLNIPLVATNDIHYVKREDSESHDILLCIQMNKTVHDRKRMRFSSDDYFLKSAEDMRKIFADYPEACENTLKIAERCNVNFEFGKVQIPVYPLPQNYSDEKIFLRDLCYQKISERYDKITDEIQSRLDYELKIINSMGFDGYFLIVWDFINFARKNKIAVGPGRGSAAGSIVSYILGITSLDPLKFNLLFERFLNPERVTMPDIDIDFCYIRREEVIEYVKKTYGEDHVAQIVTFGTLAAKAAIRDIVRALDVPYSEGSRIIEMLPNELKFTLDDAIKKSNDLKSEYENNPTTKKIIDLAKKLEGMPRHSSVHAAGIVISKNPLTDYVPVQISNDTLVTQYDKDKIEELGLLKMDFLGLRTLTIIEEAVENIKKFHGVVIDMEKIPLEDEKTAEILSSGQTGAVFQMESPGMINMIRELKPKNFFDLIPTVALYRPGPLANGMVANFIDGKHGIKTPTYLHPKLEPILKETFGVILYQEQVMQVVQTLAGFSLGQADILRRAMGKKKAEILLAQQENFLNGCEKNHIPKELAEKIFDLLKSFANYGFNKSHSVAYAFLAWQTAYLKAHYPREFMAAIMSSVMDNDKVSAYVELTRSMGIEVLGPDINLSGVHFTVENNSVRFALSAIKNLGEHVIKKVIAVRDSGGNFSSLADFCIRVDLKEFTRRSLENLIKCGAFDSIDNRRTAILESLDSAFHEGQRKKSEYASGQLGLFGEEEMQGNGYKIPDIPERPKNEILAWEKETLGFYISGHPLDEFKEKFSNLTSIKEISAGKITTNKKIKVGGIITSAKRFTTKKGDLMAFLTLEDFSDSIKITIFPQLFNYCMNLIIPDEIIVVAGKLEVGEVNQILADKIILANDYLPDVYLKISAELENPATYEKLEKIFAENRGKSSVFMNKFGKWKKLGDDKKISYNEKTFEQLKNLLGEENIKIY